VPDSSRATADWEVPIRAATSVWDRPAACRCSASSRTRRPRPSAIWAVWAVCSSARRRSAISRKPGMTGSDPASSPAGASPADTSGPGAPGTRTALPGISGVRGTSGAPAERLCSFLIPLRISHIRDIHERRDQSRTGPGQGPGLPAAPGGRGAGAPPRPRARHRDRPGPGRLRPAPAKDRAHPRPAQAKDRAGPRPAQAKDRADPLVPALLRDRDTGRFQRRRRPRSGVKQHWSLQHHKTQG
jgi:hypothetical protein